MAPPPHGRKSGVVNYTREETLHMLEALKSVLPLGPDDWALVVDRHSVMFPGRDRISISRKYNILHRKSIPTGDPLCPPEVRLAKNIKYLMGNKAEVGDAGSNFDLETGYDNGNESELEPSQLVPFPLGQPSQLDEGVDGTQNQGLTEDVTQNLGVTQDPPVARTQNTMNVTPAAAAGPLTPATKRSYSTRTTSQDILGAFERSIALQREAREEDREIRVEERQVQNERIERDRQERKEERKETKDAIEAMGKILCSVATTVATAFARPKKRRRQRDAADDEDAADEGSDSED